MQVDFGSYHYHCGGYPAHLHENGVCPYKTGSTANSSSTTKKSNTTTTVNATSIEIDTFISNIELGESKVLSCTILPSDVSNKSANWKSENSSIISVDDDGKITANKVGKTRITVSTSNDKTDSIEITVVEPKEVTLETTAVSSQNTYMDTASEEEKKNGGNNSSALPGILGVGGIAGACFFVNKKRKE